MADQAHDREHTSEHRQLILRRSMLCGLARILPLPPLEEVLTTSLRRGLLRRISEQRHVDVAESALDVLAAPRSPAPRAPVLIAALGGAGVMLRNRRLIRRLLVGAQLISGGMEGLRTLQHATLWDHYCVHHHKGPRLEEAKARRLRSCVDEAVRTTQREIGQEALDRTLSVLSDLAMGLPRRVRALLGRGDPEAGPRAEREAGLFALLDREREPGASLRDAALDRYTSRLCATFDRIFDTPQQNG